MTVHIELYTKGGCPYCVRAKRLLERKGASFEEISLDEHPELVEDIVRRSGRTTVPQIFADGRALGGCDDLHELESAGRLDRILRGDEAD